MISNTIPPPAVVYIATSSKNSNQIKPVRVQQAKDKGEMIISEKSSYDFHLNDFHKITTTLLL